MKEEKRATLSPSERKKRMVRFIPLLSPEGGKKKEVERPERKRKEGCYLRFMGEEKKGPRWCGNEPGRRE